MEVDYLISGAGASGLSFLDVLIHESDATAAIVDRRDAPGGHWVDAYPFVRLHQPSDFYGVNSRPLGEERRSTTGYNKGLPEVASKHEILHYFRDLMENVYLPTGRVTYFRNSEYMGDGRIKNLITGQITDITITKKLVNAGYWGDQTSIPSTHKRPFDVADGITCVPPNDLRNRAAGFDRFTVLGAGKTAMDSALWLMEQGVAPDAITWVRPNDYWVFLREQIIPHPDFFDQTVASIHAETNSLATAETVDEHCRNMEADGRWQRIDPDHWPTKFHAAVCSQAEIDNLRQIKNVLRAGRVTRLSPGKIEMTGGSQAVADNPLYIDCTATGGVSIDPKAQVFEENEIKLLMVRPFQPLFSAALIAHLEFGEYNDTIRKMSSQVTNFHETPAEYLPVQRQGFMNQYMWNQNPQIRAWIDASRLNAAFHLTKGLKRDDTDKIDRLKALGSVTAKAVENIPKMLANSAS
ncbi:MAG: NAD(P)/FAD-dependent oxidoreductase [Rhodobacteraceae bacterium]|nr:NAD(P)/FAD-dependent oxidoreductase [Paracoccaceae bacterium]